MNKQNNNNLQDNPEIKEFKPDVLKTASESKKELHPNHELGKRLKNFYDIPMKIKVILGGTKMKIKDIINLNKDSIVILNKAAGESVEVYINNMKLAQGEIIVSEDTFGVRITDIVELEKTLRSEIIENLT